MNLNHNISCTPVSVNEDNKVANIAFDGHFYYLILCCGTQIVKTDLDFQVICCFDVCRKYRYMCYDWKEKSFWAVAESDHLIYNLNFEMQEIGGFCLRHCACEESKITGISYNCCCDKLALSYENAVVKVDKCSGQCEQLFQIPHGIITAVLSLCPIYLVAVYMEEGQFVYTVSSEGKPEKSHCIRPDIIIKNILFDPCSSQCDGEKINFYVFKDYCPYLCSIPFHQFNKDNKPCKCNFKICNDCKSDCCHQCCENCCQDDCKDHCPPSPPHDCFHLIESIAMVEAAIAHILNAEGEKLQKILAISNDINEILCVNREINELIINVTRLEHILYAKLTAAIKLCGDRNFCCRKAD